MTPENGRGTSLLLRTYALMRGLWQSLDYPEHLQKLLAHAMFEPIRPDSKVNCVPLCRSIGQVP